MEVETLLAKAQETLSAGRSFGPLIEHDGCAVVPVALVAGGGGGGGGNAPGTDATSGGGGFGGVSLPLGAYVIKDGTVRWVPALDATRVALGVLALARAIVRARARRARP